MLQAIRSKAGSFVVKLLFALLILTFGVWGIGDIFRTAFDRYGGRHGRRPAASAPMNCRPRCAGRSNS